MTFCFQVPTNGQSIKKNSALTTGNISLTVLQNTYIRCYCICIEFKYDHLKNNIFRRDSINKSNFRLESQKEIRCTKIYKFRWNPKNLLSQV